MPIAKRFLSYDPTFNVRESGDVHVLTLAEEGFAMLNVYANHQLGIPKEQLVQFADRVNERNEVGTLHPRAPLSSVPRHLIREPHRSSTVAKDNLAAAIREFLQANRAHGGLRCRRVLFDFVSVSSKPLSGYVVPAIIDALASEDALPTSEQVVEEALIVAFLNETKPGEEDH